ncbi:hypothetical protein ACFL6I_19200 [candidate division KSB1 bacterium]
MVKKTLKLRSQFGYLHMVALFIMAIGVIFVTFNYRAQERLGLGTPRVMEKYVIAKMYHIIEERNVMMLRAGSVLQLQTNEELGSYLADGQGRALYNYKNDEFGKSNCYDECADQWPALWTEGQIALGEGVDGELGIIERTDGPWQVTYDQKPLYFYANDEEIGGINGHDVDGWSVARP